MNERIKVIAKRAGAHISTQCLTSNPVQYRESIGLWDDRIERFAELIVQECCEVAHCNAHVDGLTLGTIFKEYFGMEQ